jgi:AcrR family transcriptional regulator
MPRGVPLSEYEKQEARSRIFKVAARLFLKNGFHETSMRELARAAGMGKSTLYDYFPSKAELLLFFVEQEMDITHRAASEIAGQRIPAPVKLKHILQSLWAYLDENRAMASLTAREASRLGADETARMNRRRAEYRKILEGVIEQGIREGAFREVDPTLAASALHSMMTMPFYDWLRRGEPGGAEGNADMIVDLFLKGIERV